MNLLKDLSRKELKAVARIFGQSNKRVRRLHPLTLQKELEQIDPAQLEMAIRLVKANPSGGSVQTFIPVSRTGRFTFNPLPSSDRYKPRQDGVIEYASPAAQPGRHDPR